MLIYTFNLNKAAINLNEKFISCLWIVNRHDKSIFHCQISSEPQPIPILCSRCHVRCKSNKIEPFCWKISVRHQVHRWLINSRTLLKSAPSVLQVRRFWTSLLLWSWSYGSWMYNYLYNQCISPLKLWVRILLRQGVLDTRLCDIVCRWLVTFLVFSWYSSFLHQ
jgi:hypothetical protein